MKSTMSILVVDDDPSDRALVRRTLENGFISVNIAEADSRANVERILTTGACDVIVTDCKLRGANGIDIIDLIRGLGVEVPIVMLTGSGTEEIAIEAMKRGVADYVTKTEDHIECLPLTIAHALEKAQSERDGQRMEQAIRENEKRYRMLVENSRLCIHEIDLEGRIISINHAGLAMLGGIEERDVYGSCYTESVFEDDRPRVDALLSQAREGKASHFEFRSIVDGKIRHFASCFTPLRGEDNDIEKLMGITEDITERITLKNKLERLVNLERAARENAEESEKQISNTLERITDGFVALDRDWRYTFLNKKAGELLGRDPKDLVGKNIWEEFPEGVGEPFYHAYHEAMTTQKTIMLEEYFGPWERWFENRIYPSSVGISIFFQDVTVRKRAEADLLRAEKLELVGLLAGGIAHDFNNMLTGIIGNISLARMYAGDGKKSFEVLSRAERACGQAQSLTQRLLTFSTGGEPVKKIMSIVDLLRENAEFVLSGATSQCTFAIAETLWTVEVDPGQFAQVIQNLIVNANQSMPDGGVINVEAENVTLSEEDGLPLAPGRHVRISVADHGVGISASLLSKVFDPFFTTKQRGSGLGLATSYSIVKQHGGYITVNSDIDVGSTFHIYLPHVAGDVDAADDDEELTYAGKGRVLIMDDDELVREFSGDALAELGYTVATARDGADAISLYADARASAEPFDLVVLDLTVPGGMGGKDAFMEIRKIEPKVKAIVSSGYSNDPILSNYEQYGFVDAIAKPYKVGKLSEVVHKAINDAG